MRISPHPARNNPRPALCRQSLSTEKSSNLGVLSGLPPARPLPACAYRPSTVRNLPKEHIMVSKESVQAVLDRVRPFLNADGGDIELVGDDGHSAATSFSLDDRLRDVEANLIGWALKVSGGNKSRAAELLQIKRSTLGDRINRCGLGRADSEAVATGPSSAVAVS
jgi:DNA-binding protein Fis